jgi:uncharacterized protein (DUF433 family)
MSGQARPMQARPNAVPRRRCLNYIDMEWVLHAADHTMTLDRITFDDQIMGGRACIRGMRIPVSVVLKMLAGGMSAEQILSDYPDLEPQDIEQSMQYAAILADERVTTH